MRFPDYQRVIFDKNPLADVTCQLRHPRILAVDSVLPVEFQNKLCDEYPALQQTKLNLQVASGESGTQESQLLARSYNFKDSTGDWTVALTSAFLALTTNKYTQWEEFRTRLASVVKAHEECYRVPFYERIGLRYRDVIDRRALGIEQLEWRQLVRPELLGLLALDDVDEKLISNTHVLNELQLEHGSLTVQSYFISNSQESDEVGLMIDCDFSVEKKISRGDDAVFKALNEFHRYAGQVFSWAICDPLREALGPRPIE